MAEEPLEGFLDEAATESRLRVEQDLGGGFVRLRLSEAQRRQAAQDIGSSEDVVIELLRNARDAGARRIYVATQTSEGSRIITVVDDGCGIPQDMHERIFEPRVTSKLDTAHRDKWGLHGRGMALYSIRENARKAHVSLSEPGKGSALEAVTDLGTLSERSDQSTFPRFERGAEGAYAMRGPRNILRTCAEFALEHRDECSVWCGSPAEVVATLYAFGMVTTTASLRAFRDPQELPLVQRLACAADPSSLAQMAQSMGLAVSERTARRVMDGSMGALPSLMERLEREVASLRKATRRKEGQGGHRQLGQRAVAALAPEDAETLSQAAKEAFREVAERYYLEADVAPSVSLRGDSLRIDIPLIPQG